MPLNGAELISPSRIGQELSNTQHAMRHAETLRRFTWCAMPKGPQGQKRPGDVIGAAIMVAKIATGEVEDTADETKAHHRAGGKKGAASRAQALSPERRSEIARKAAAKRWGP